MNHSKPLLLVGILYVIIVLWLTVEQLSGHVSVIADDTYLPRGVVYNWQAIQVWGHFLTDSCLWVCSWLIPVQLMILWRRMPYTQGIQRTTLIVSFSVFVFGSGTTRVMDVINLWAHFYWVDLWIRSITALAAVTTVVMLWRIIPKKGALP
jgi:hypothetical protein